MTSSDAETDLTPIIIISIIKLRILKLWSTDSAVTGGVNSKALVDRAHLHRRCVQIVPPRPPVDSLELRHAAAIEPVEVGPLAAVVPPGAVAGHGAVDDAIVVRTERHAEVIRSQAIA